MGTGSGEVRTPAVDLCIFVVGDGFFGSCSVAPSLVVTAVVAVGSVVPDEELLKKELSSVPLDA